jgi:hypothetical protein
MPEDFTDALIVARNKDKVKLIVQTKLGLQQHIIPVYRMLKTFVRIILNRLISIAEAILPEADCGFCLGQSTVDRYLQ